MRLSSALVAAALLLAVAFAGEDTEPPQLFTLDVDGVATAVRLDEPFTVKIGDRDVPMTLRVAEHRVFDATGVSFRYPRHFTFEYEKDVFATIWTLEGPSTVLILTRGPRQNPATAARDTALGSMGALGASGHEKTELVTKAGKLEGVGFTATVAMAQLRQEVYAFDVPGGTCILIVQDLLNDDGTGSEATKKAVALFAESLAIAKE